MAKYSVYIHYSAFGEISVEAESKDEAIELACENLDSINFEGDYDILEVNEVGNIK